MTVQIRINGKALDSSIAIFSIVSSVCELGYKYIQVVIKQLIFSYSPMDSKWKQNLPKLTTDIL